MSAISALGRGVHGAAAFRSLRSGSTAGDSTSLTSPTLAGSVTGNAGALAPAAHNLAIGPAKLKQIERAVTAALQSAKPTDDPRQVVRTAIAQAIKAPNPHGTNAQDASDLDGSHRTFLQTLAAYGISPQQFHADLARALDHRNGTHASQSSFPPGIVLDATA